MGEPLLFGIHGQVLSTKEAEGAVVEAPPGVDATLDEDQVQAAALAAAVERARQIEAVLIEAFALIAAPTVMEQRWKDMGGQEACEATIGGSILELVGKETLERALNITIDLETVFGPGGALERPREGAC